MNMINQNIWLYLGFGGYEKLVWGDGEDIEWSFQVREKYNYKMNVHSIVNMLKSKKVSAEHLEKDDNEPNNLWIKKYQKRLL